MTDQFSKNKALSSTDKISVAAEYLNTAVSEVDGTLKTWNGSSHSNILPDDLTKIEELYKSVIEV